ATAIVKVPAYVSEFVQIDVRAITEDGGELGAQQFSPTAQPGVLLFDVDESSHLRGALNETAIAPSYVPSSASAGAWRSGSTTTTLTIGSPRVDPASGDPILPDRAASYAPAAAVLVTSERLIRLGDRELEALAGYVIAGGTLALVITRLDDLRHPRLAALV